MVLLVVVIIVSEASELGLVNFGEFDRDPFSGEEKLPAIDLDLQTLWYLCHRDVAWVLEV